jgi:hypothetical protein
MELHEIMTQIKGTSTDGLTKTASAPAPGAKTAGARDKLLSALDGVLTPGEKTAAAQPGAKPATGELVKMATDLANSESAALVKEAQFYGAAVADGFMSRLGQYESAAAKEPVPTLKTASADGVPTQAEFEKFASENPDLTKQAIDLGYLHGKAQIEQLKVAAFEKGYADTQKQIVELQKTAAGQTQLQKVATEFNSENQLAAELEKLAETPEGREKLAEIKRGYSDTMNELTKMAGDTFDRGYGDTINVIRAM